MGEWGYHWYVYDRSTGTWWNKNGTWLATDRELSINDHGQFVYDDAITDHKHAASSLDHSIIVGEFYITKQDGSCF